LKRYKKVIEMSASATQTFDSPAQVADTSMSASLDNAWAQLAGDQVGSAFNQPTTPAKEITEQHVAAGNLPTVAINSGDLTQVG
jgi:hypothetical protein